MNSLYCRLYANALNRMTIYETVKEYVISLYSSINRRHSHSTRASSQFRIFGWLLVVFRIYVASAVFQPYRELEAGDNQSLEFEWRDQASCSASQKLNHSATAAPFKYLRVPRFATILMGTIMILSCPCWSMTLKSRLVLLRCLLYFYSPKKMLLLVIITNHND